MVTSPGAEVLGVFWYREEFFFLGFDDFFEE